MGKTKIILVTGGGSGIGRATALQFAADGALVVICGRNLERLQQTALLAQSSRGRIEPFQLDLTDEAAVKDMVEQITREFGVIDIVINNAGMALHKSFLETTTEEWQEIVGVNLFAAVHCCRAVLPTMLAAGNGLIITISSTLGKKAIGCMSAYCCAKFSIIALTQSLAEETKGTGVRVYTVCPGSTDTPLHRAIVGDERALQAMPPEKVAHLIFSIARGDLKLPSGADIVIDERPDLSLRHRVKRSIANLIDLVRATR